MRERAKALENKRHNSIQTAVKVAICGKAVVGCCFLFSFYFPLLLRGVNILLTLFGLLAYLLHLNDKKWYVAALLSWGLALFEYLFQVPANRIGYSQYSLGQLKILQEIITLAVFAPFALFYMHQPLKLNFLWAGLCMVGAVYFMFRSN